MNNSSWQRAKEIFQEARDIPISVRDAFLDERCSAEPELRSEVEKLLGSYDSDFLEDTALDAAEALVKTSLAEGQIIGRYRVGKLIGSGGMGQVFLAEDTELGRPVAFKVLHHDVGADDERLRRFIQEARAASALNHPNILTIHEIGSFEGFRYIVSEYVDGETLRDRIRHGIDTAESVEITCQIAAALRAAHSAGIVHRDIKPENVMLRRDGLVKVLDFGLAKLTEADDRPIDPNATASAIETSPGLVMGTAAYMSPEQASGQSVDLRTDLWSLGVVFHEMLTGASPFEGESVTELISSILRSDVSDKLDEKIPPELQPICRKALAKDKDSRYRSAHDLLKDLEGEKKRMEYSFQPSRYVSVSTTDELKTQLIRPRPTLSAEYIVTSVKRHKYASLATLLVVFMLGVGVAAYRYNAAPVNLTDSAAIDENTSESDLKITRIAASGSVREIAVSPDGKYVAYISGPKQTSIHVTDLASQTDTEVVPAPPEASGATLMRPVFTPDGRRVIYQRDTSGSEEMFSVSVLGGESTKIIDANGLSISPDGKRMAFLRDIYSKDRKEKDAEWIGYELVSSRPDGSEQKVLLRSTNGQSVPACHVPAWSPDSKYVACWLDSSEGRTKFSSLHKVDVSDGSSTPVGDKKWREISGVAWTTGGNLLVSAKESIVVPSQIWVISSGGSPKAVTSGLVGYIGLSASRSGDVIVAKQQIVRRDLWILPDNSVEKAQPITTSGEIECSFAFLPDGRIVYCSSITGADIWVMNADGSGRKQLTANQGLNGQPRPSSDGKYILFHSNRADPEFHIFRMLPDGGAVKQLTEGSTQTSPRSSPDGKQVFYLEYDGFLARKVCRVPIDGGEKTVLASISDGRILDLHVGPDGRVAYAANTPVNGVWKTLLYIISPENGKVLKTLMLPGSSGGYIHWTPDGKAIAYNETSNGAGDIWAMPIDGRSKPKQLTNFRTPTTWNFDWNKKGDQLLLSRGMGSSDPVMIRRSAQ